MKKSKKVSKNAEFHADFRTVEKIEKNIYPKEVTNKNVTEICTFCSA